jgi:DNA-directed RNA polymerase subunit F
MNNSISEFCEKRKIPIQIESAFRAFCKTDYAMQFQFREGETIQKIVSNLTDKQVLEAWDKFVIEFSKILPKTF